MAKTKKKKAVDLSKVFLCIPTQSKVNIQTVKVILQWLPYGVTIFFSEYPLIDNARNKAVDAFLLSDCEYLLFLDSDIVPPVDSIAKLILDDKDVVGGLHLIWKGIEGKQSVFGTGAYTKIGKLSNDHYTQDNVQPKQGLKEVMGLSTAYMMIKRKVLEKMKRPWFWFRWTDEAHTSFGGEDYNFCLLARQAGFKVWCDTDIEVDHIREIRF